MTTEAKVLINNKNWINVKVRTGETEQWDMGDGFTASLEDRMNDPFPYTAHVITNPGGGRSIGILYSKDNKKSFNSEFNYSDNDSVNKIFKGKDIKQTIV